MHFPNTYHFFLHQDTISAHELTNKNLVLLYIHIWGLYGQPLILLPHDRAMLGMNPKNVLLISFFYQAQSWTSWAGKWGRIKFVCWNTLFEGWRLSIDIGYLSKNCHYFLFEHYLSLSIRLNLELRWSAARRGGQAAHHARHHGRERPLHAAHSPAHQPAHQTRQTLPTTGGLCPFLSLTLF